jgi:hypothetical protein
MASGIKIIVSLMFCFSKQIFLFCNIYPVNFAVPCYLKGSFTCRKSATWDRRLYFPSEGRHAEQFFALKNPTALAGFEPANLGTEAACGKPYSALQLYDK